MDKGQHVVIADNVRIGDQVVIGNHVVIHEDTIIGHGVRIDDNAVIGKLPMRANRSATTQDRKLPQTEIGNGCIIGTGAIVYRSAKIGDNVLVADQTSVREEVTIGEETIIGRGVYVENKSSIGARCKLEANAYITAFSVVGDDCFIAPGALTSNDNFLGRDPKRFEKMRGPTLDKGARVGVGAILLPGVYLAEDGVAGAGAVVTKDVPQRKIVAGIPAKVFRVVPDEQLLENQ